LSLLSGLGLSINGFRLDTGGVDAGKVVLFELKKSDFSVIHLLVAFEV